MVSTPEWEIAVQYGCPADYGIPHAPTNVEDGRVFMMAENTWKVRR